ncbi:hypothetical protein C5167_016135 [Papaver somniferum]|nr:hypothetical protein C5167_016135 [Papaver somniferum]
MVIGERSPSKKTSSRDHYEWYLGKPNPRARKYLLKTITMVRSLSIDPSRMVIRILVLCEETSPHDHHEWQKCESTTRGITLTLVTAMSQLWGRSLPKEKHCT